MEKELITSRSKVIAAYNDADDNGKKMLRNLYGEELFLSGYQKIKTYEYACKVTGENPDFINTFTLKHLKAYIKLCTIAKALNKDWEPDWANFDEQKYFPYFELAKMVDTQNHDSFAILSYCGEVVTQNTACHGGALASKSEEIAIYFGKQFAEIWKDYLIV